MGRTNPAAGGTDYTPLYDGLAMFALALLIPWSMLIQRWLYGVRGVSLHSVLSRFRLEVFGRALLVIGPIWLVPTIVLTVSMPAEQTFWSTTDLIAFFALTILLTPLQSAGEEYGLRGLVLRVAGSWNRGPRIALVVGILASSLLFTSIHGAGDPWINVWYFTLAVSLAVITWPPAASRPRSSSTRCSRRSRSSSLHRPALSCVLWACWSSAWMLRVLRELQAAHETRAALALANERLRISRDLHDVFGRTLAPTGGTGVRAMSERVRALGGHVTTRRDGGWFLQRGL
ncbi:hypothetical protein GCM10027570_14150 [Streptomonospora sediminis]